jgi:hypothetical protein
MFELFSEPARRALFFARYDASVLGSTSIETEHLLLGILKERQPVLMHVLGTANVTAEQLRGLVYERANRGQTTIATSVEIPFSQDCKQVLAFTAEEADRLLHREIGTEHLLLGLLRLEHGLAWNVLSEQGVRLGPVREALVMHVSATPPPEVARMIAALAPGGGARTDRPAALYLMTVLDAPARGRRAVAHDTGAGVFFTFTTVGFGTVADRAPDGRIHTIGPITMSAVTLPQFAAVLEPFLDAAIVVDDDAMSGTFDIELKGTFDDAEKLIAALRDQLGLVLEKSVG